MQSKTFIFILIACGTVIGLAGTDLVLPAIPMLPTYLGGDLKAAQWVLAAFALGTAIGLLMYGELGSRFKIGNLLVVSLLSYATISYISTYATSLFELSFLRFFQGVVAAGPAVFAPVMVKSMFESRAAIAMLGRIGSLESVTPALAPILGAWLLEMFGWKASFYITAITALLLSIIWLLSKKTRQGFGYSQNSTEGYFSLVKNRSFIRHALSQAFTLGALIVIVFAAPTVITTTMNGKLSDFITMQVIGVAFFIVSANTSHKLVERFGDEIVITFGSALSALGCIAIFSLGLFSSKPSVELLWSFFVCVNLGFGIRAPVGFYKALQSAGTNESRGSALIVLFIMLTVAIGTALVAPFIEEGLVYVGAIAASISIASVWLSSRFADSWEKRFVAEEIS